MKLYFEQRRENSDGVRGHPWLERRNVGHYTRKILGRGVIVKEQWLVKGRTGLFQRKYEYRIGKSARGFSTSAAIVTEPSRNFMQNCDIVDIEITNQIKRVGVS